ncbi:MAG TPA: HTH domain-containing protein, partial [Phytomonospora sp.]
MKAGRLVALLLTLQTERGATAARLAEALEVSVRTIYRDVTALQSAGVPLWTEPGPTGGIRLLDGWRTRLDGLTGDEAASLFAGTAPAVLDGLGLGTVAVAAQAKVLATLPPELRDRAGRLRERFHLDAPTWFAGPD